MLFSPFALGVTLLSVVTEARDVKRSNEVQPVVRELSDIVETSLVLDMVKSPAKSIARRYSSGPNGVSKLNHGLAGEVWVANVTFGTQTVYLSIDTGTADTWVARTGYQCYDPDTDEKVAEGDCQLGASYTPGKSFKALSPHQDFIIFYGGGSHLNGTMGKDDLTVAGIKVHGAQIALVENAAWYGDNIGSGLLGFAYPDLTRAYNSSGDQQVYDPFFTQMYKQGLVSHNLFSLSLLRGTSGPAGYLALGGVVASDVSLKYTSTPILKTSYTPPTDYNYYYYTIKIDGLYVNGVKATNSSADNVMYIVDSGYTVSVVPTATSEQLAAAYNPPAKYSEEDGVYYVDCNSTAPDVTVRIGGMDLVISPLDLVFLNDEGNCIGGFNNGGLADDGRLFVLGTTFLRNVVAVYDVGGGAMRFAQKTY